MEYIIIGMESNKDEAYRAKMLAEQKMATNDFEGARKIALKVKQLLCELDNISQLITVCDIHCSAQQKIYGVEKDLYGILQVESVADEATIRKQYRKLALLLHPDKNNFPGAEAAFKLIAEANMVLSDKGKRSAYDMKCRDSARAFDTKLQHRQGNQSSYTVQNNFKNVPSSQFNGMNHHYKQSTSNASVRSSFWTFCPFCNIKYEYFKEYVNKPLQCQQCSRFFIAHDIGMQGAAAGTHFSHKKMQSVNLGTNQAQPPVPQQKDVEGQEKVKVNIQKVASHIARQKAVNTGVGGSSRTVMNQGGVTMAHVNTQKPLETGTSKGMNKRRRKMVVESSESSSEEEETAFKGASGGPGGDSVERRRSARQKQQVSYQEGGSDDLIPRNRSRSRIMEEVPTCDDNSCKPANVDKEVNKQKACEHGNNMEKHIMKGAEPAPLDHSGNLSPEIVDCPDSEFSNFDKDKEAHCFAVDQIWACYDSLDSLPRFYALVRRIYKSEFRLRFTWLEPELESNAEIKWVEGGLPVACGKFVKGKTEETKNSLMFSHQMIYEKGSRRFSYVIYPRAGEIWALFKDWNIEWSLDPEHHKRYKFDIVEILSVQDDGISVAFLLKVKGFVSVFQRTIPAELAKLTIPYNERLRFSHRIKSVKLKGTEREGVPSGSFELDMASLPLEDYCYFNKATINPNNAMGQTSQSHVEKVKPATHLSNTRKKYMNGLDSKMLNLRRSPRGLKGGDQSNGLKDRVTNGQSSQSAEETVKPAACLSYTPSKRLNGLHNEMVSLRRSPRGLTGNQSNGDIDTISERFMKSPSISSLSPACGELKHICHDFSSDRKIPKFKVGQVWAFWEKNSGIRQCYAQIKQIESDPFTLHASLLKVCNIPSNYSIRHNACGLFKVSAGITEMLPLESFSHIVKAEAKGKDIFSIYPSEKQIWALHRSSDLKVGECDIVEVVESDENSTKVSLLTCVPGYKTVFKALKIKGSTEKILVIPRIELNRFSHQIPAFLFTEEKDGCLRGCWELDPAAITGLLEYGIRKWKHHFHHFLKTSKRGIRKWKHHFHHFLKTWTTKRREPTYHCYLLFPCINQSLM